MKPEEVAKKIKTVLAVHSMTQKDFCIISGLAESTVSEIITCKVKKRVNFKTIGKILNAIKKIEGSNADN